MKVRIGISTVDLTQQLGASGGQGTVWLHPQDPNTVVKSFRDACDYEDGGKLRYLVEHPLHPSGGCHLYAWPREIAYDPASDAIIGFAMDRVAGATEIAAIVNANGWLSFEFLIRVAKHICVSLKDLHQNRFVRGDINLTNTLVAADGSISEIDIDSLQVNAGGKAFRCGVGVFDFAPPELQGRAFQDIDATVEHDRWAVAVLLWMLLRQAGQEHPFAARYTGQGRRHPRSKRIEMGYWPYSANPHPDYLPPRAGPDFQKLPPGLRRLFSQTFDAGHSTPSARPTLDEWIATLTALDGGCCVTLDTAMWQCVTGGTAPKLTPIQTPVGTRYRRLGPGRFGRHGAAAAIVGSAIALGVSSWALPGVKEVSTDDNTVIESATPVSTAMRTEASKPKAVLATATRRDVELSQLPASPGAPHTPPLWSVIRKQEGAY